MDKVDPALAVQPVEALHHVVGLARAHDATLVCGITGAFAPCHQCGHGPEPSLLGVPERFATTLRGESVAWVELA
ncbi:MAG TPA: hypothetical protein VGI78_10175, partial [Acetobacteraceae bacterium]